MLLREFLEKNAEELIGRVFNWKFGGRNFLLKVVSKNGIQYKNDRPEATSWGNVKFSDLRRFRVRSVEVLNRIKNAKIVITTDDPLPGE